MGRACFSDPDDMYPVSTTDWRAGSAEVHALTEADLVEATDGHTMRERRLLEFLVGIYVRMVISSAIPLIAMVRNGGYPWDGMSGCTACRESGQTVWIGNADAQNRTAGLDAAPQPTAACMEKPTCWAAEVEVVEDDCRLSVHTRHAKGHGEVGHADSVPAESAHHKAARSCIDTGIARSHRMTRDPAWYGWGATGAEGDRDSQGGKTAEMHAAVAEDRRAPNY